MAAGQPLRVVVVEDHPLTRNGFRLALTVEHGFVIVGEAGTATEGRRLVREMRPDVVLLDITLPDYDGDQLAQELLAEWPGLPILAITAGLEPARRLALYAMGVLGLVEKSIDGHGLVYALQKTAEGKVVRVHMATEPVPRLSKRMDQIVRLMAAELTDAEIAQELGVAVSTIHTHNQKLFERLGVESRLAAVQLARKLGLLR